MVMYKHQSHKLIKCDSRSTKLLCHVKLVVFLRYHPRPVGNTALTGIKYSHIYKMLLGKSVSFQQWHNFSNHFSNFGAFRLKLETNKKLQIIEIGLSNIVQCTCSKLNLLTHQILKNNKLFHHIAYHMWQNSCMQKIL